MTKQLKLNLQKDKLLRQLLALYEQASSFEARKKDLEDKVERSAELSDEEIEQVERDIDALDAEIKEADLEEKKANLEAQIREIEAELESIEAPKDPEPETKPEESNKNTEKENRNTMRNAFFRRVLREYEDNEELKSFASRIRSMMKGETRAVSGAELGIPSFVLDPIRDRASEYSKLSKHVNLKRVSGTARQPVVGTAPEAVWTEQAGILNELEIAFNAPEVDGYKVAGFVPVPNYIIDDNDIGLVAEVSELIAHGIGKALDKAIVYGTGVKQPLGIVTRLASENAVRDMGKYAPAWTDLHTSNIGYLSSGSLTPTELYAELADGLGNARSEYGDEASLFWAMSTKTWTKLKTKLISINAAGAIVTGAEKIMPVIGGAVEILDFMPDNVIAGGYGNLYLLAERAGIDIQTSEHAMFIEDNTVFKGVARYDGLPVIGEGFAMFTIDTSAGDTSVEFPEDKANPGEAWLTALSGTGLTLSPTFNKGKFAYTASVANGTSSTTISATARQYGKVGKLTLNGTEQTGSTITLAVGENVIGVPAIYGNSKQVYTITVTRAGS